MRRLVLPAALVLAAAQAAAGEISSAYTEIDTASDCAVFAAAGEDDGDWTNLACSGWRGYPVLIYYADARESYFYGFPPEGDLAPPWESFAGFNSAGPRVEWRIETDGNVATPFATIHRWSVAGEGGRDVQVLVVEKVAGLHERMGCVVGYVVATGNPGHNDAARRIADDRARSFICGSGVPEVDEGSVPLPPPYVAAAEP